jgi:beta propeller repeat protein
MITDTKEKKLQRSFPFFVLRVITLLCCVAIVSGIFCTCFADSVAGSPVESQFTGTESLLTTSTSGSDQELSAIWDDRVVWRSRYPDPANSNFFLEDIYLYNLTTGNETKLGEGVHQVNRIDICEDLVVWNSWEGDYSDIYLYTISTNEVLRITNDTVNHVKPQVWGDHIVWQEGDDSDSEWNIYLYDISTRTTLELGDGSGLAMSPATWGDRVVWQDGRNGVDFDIYLYNITTGTEIPITNDSADQVSPSIWGDRIVWQDFRDTTSQVYVYDISTGNETQVTSSDGGSEDPVISGNNVVFVNQSDYFDIYLTDIPAWEQGKISQDTTGSAQMDPDIWGARIIWTDGRNGDYDIFLYTLGISMTPLSANFTQNITQGEPPLTVEFLDNSSGQVNGRNWNFGDTTTSDEENPVHTFSTAGSFSVTLTVHNPMQRDAVTRTDLISVGTPPVPQFTANSTSGAAPLTVSFSDASPGSPAHWHWDFGDGETSEEQNPVYVYATPGVYDVSLTVNNTFGEASVARTDYITVMDGTTISCKVPSEGITVNEGGATPLITVNMTGDSNGSYSLQQDDSVLEYVPDQKYGFRQLEFYSNNTVGFSVDGNGTVSGILTGMRFTSEDIALRNFSQTVGTNCSFNFTLSPPVYIADGMIDAVAWEGCTPDDNESFDDIKSLSIPSYSKIKGIAYTAKFNEVNYSETGPAHLVFGVSSDWVEEYGWADNRDLEIKTDPTNATVYIDEWYVGISPVIVSGLAPGPHKVKITKSGLQDLEYTEVIGGPQDSIHIIRIDNDGSGEVLDTTYIGHDPERNLDFFRADSPNGLSTFGMTSLSGSGNLFKLVYLAAVPLITGGGGSGGVYQPAATPTPVPSLTAGPTLTPFPTIPSGGKGGGSPGPTGTPVPPTTALPGTSPTIQGFSPTPTGDGGMPWMTSMVLLKNLSVVFVVVLVTLVFYLRWNKREE